MKKIYLFVLSAALLTVGINANAQSQKVLSKSNIAELQKSNRLPIGAKRLNVQTRTLGQSYSSQVRVNKAPAANALPTVADIITDQPAGTLHVGARSGFYTYSFFGYILGGSYSNTVGDWVVSDSAIYIKEPLHGLTTNSWLKLDKVDDENYVAHLPQAIYSETVTQDDGTDTTYVYYAKRFVFTGQTYAEDSTTAGSVDAHFTYKNGVLQSVDTAYDASGFPLAAINLTDETNGFYGYLDGATKFEEVTEKPTALPSTATPENYELDNTTYSGTIIPAQDTSVIDSSVNRSIVRVAFDGNDVYINNPSTKSDDSWIKGTIEGNKAIFKPQYIGIDSTQNVFTWFEPATFTLVNDSSYYDYFGEIDVLRSYSLADELVFDYDPTTKSFSAPANTSFLINAAPDRVYYVDTYDEAKLNPWEETEGTPADPEFTDFDNEFADYGDFALVYNIPDVDTTGKLMNVDKVYFNLFTSDDPENPYELTEDEGYNYYSGDPANIPYTYSDGNDVNASGTTHYNYFYFDPTTIDSIGVQSFYNGAGVLHNSNVVWFNVGAATAINNIQGDHSGIKGVAYYDLSGRQVNAPKQTGIYIKEVTYADGTKKGVKFIKK